MQQAADDKLSASDHRMRDMSALRPSCEHIYFRLVMASLMRASENQPAGSPALRSDAWWTSEVQLLVEARWQ